MIFDGQVGDTIKLILQDICSHYHYTIRAMEAMPDHIHLFIDCPQTVAPCDVVRTLKSISAIRLFEAYPSLKRFYQRCGALWSAGCLVCTVCEVSAATVQR